MLIVSNLMAMLIQYLSAKAGIATGKSLAELCRDAYPRRVTYGLWAQAEIVAIATDLAEVLGGALALRLLFGLPLLVGGLITAVVAFALLGLQSRGARPLEVAVTGLLLVVLSGFVYSLVAGGVDPAAVVSGLEPRFEGVSSLLLATGMLGATVMPHVIYLHGSLTQNRYARATEQQRLGLMRSQRLDVISAMSLAGAVNVIMLVVAARVLSGGSAPVTTIEARPPGTRSGARVDRGGAVRAGAARLGFRGVRGRDARRARSSCRASCGGGSPWSCGASSPWPPRSP